LAAENTRSQQGRRRGGGIRRSSSVTFHRRLWLVRRLVRGAATAHELVTDAQHTFGKEIYPHNVTAALHHDFDALRELFDCTIKRMHDGCYALVDYGHLALLDLNDEELETLSFMVTLFSANVTPNAVQVQRLLERIIALLPTERRAIFNSATRHLRLEVPETITQPDVELLKRLQHHLGQQYIRFRYRSTHSPAHIEEEHRVAPYRLLVRDGHTYLEAFCLAAPHAEIINRYVTYRVDRIIPESLVVEPKRMPPTAPPRKTWQIRYRLTAQVARQRDIALWFTNSSVTFLPDGSAEITAQTTDLWQARQILFCYREHCQVLEPPELIDMIRTSLQKMQECYQ
jgi:predicted DNA-binding transcriptional regulator YafY